MSFTESELWLVANDGVRLDATALVPDGQAPPGGWPGLILVHGHGDDGSKAMTLDARGRAYAERGYVVLAYSVRGQGSSEGLSFHLGARELFDLQDVVRWALAELPIDPARLGVVGSSQGGWHAWMAAAHCPEVRVAVPMNIFDDYADFAVSNGLLSTWFFTRTMRRRVLSAGLQDLARQWAIEGRWDTLREWLRPSSPRIFADRIRCPVMVVHGWYDLGMPANGVLSLFDRLAVPKHLVIGGGGHDGHDDADALAHRADLERRWLDRWLRDGEPGPDRVISAVVRPGWAHHDFSSIPAADGSTRTLWLHPGRLEPSRPTVPRPPLNIHNRVLDAGYDLRAALADDLAGARAAVAREEVVLDSPPFEADALILGEPRLVLHTISSGPGAQVHADLYDVGPDGNAVRITRGHWGDRAVASGVHRTVELPLRTIAYHVTAGHHLRLVLANTDPHHALPFFDGFTTRVRCDPAHASSLELPLAPPALHREAVPGARP